MKSENTKVSRKDFLRILGYAAVGLGLESLITGCSPSAIAPFSNTFPSATPSPTPTAAPTPTPVPTATFTPGQAAAAEREARRTALIEKYGTATRALSLEFHGDYYYMIDGKYNMDPATFSYLMEWLQDQDFWAVNGAELIGFLDGTIQLPARCVVLTTDSGYTSMDSIARMTPVLQRTGMHFISLIWTKRMDTGETIACENDFCWETFRAARDSGVFTFGSHSENHLNFSNYQAPPGLADILKSKAEIEHNLGIEVELLSWPYEACPTWMSELNDHGFKAAFGGRSRPLEECSVYYKDPLRWCLPRLFPPNRGNLISSRPFGMTIEDLARAYSDGFEG